MIGPSLTSNDGSRIVASPFRSMTVAQTRRCRRSQVIRAGSIPRSRAIGSACRSISVAWPRRLAVGRTSLADVPTDLGSSSEASR